MRKAIIIITILALILSVVGTGIMVIYVENTDTTSQDTVTINP